MGKVLIFPIEEWSAREQEKYNEIETDLLIEKAAGVGVDNTLPSDEQIAKVKENISKDIKEGKLFAWLKDFEN